MSGPPLCPDGAEDQRVHRTRKVERAAGAEPRQGPGAMLLHDGRVGLSPLSTEKQKQGLALMRVFVRSGREAEAGSGKEKPGPDRRRVKARLRARRERP